jgi:hypothetical protein
VFILYPNVVWFQTSLAIQMLIHHPELKDSSKDARDMTISATIIMAIILALVLGGVVMAVYGLILWTALDSSCIYFFENQFWWLFLVMKTNTVLLFVIVLFRYSECGGVLAKNPWRQR